MAMEELATGGFVGKFGLDLKLLVAQAVNFLIILLVLSRFVFRPLLKTMRERTERIDRGLKDAAAARQQREAVRTWEESERARVRAEAASLLSTAEAEARSRREALLRQAEADAEAMHDRAAREAEALQRDALARAHNDIGTLAIDVAERVLSTTLSSEDREAFVERALEDVRRHSRGAK
jgi:F-type H+-transporting ATPase subunit b